MSLIITFVDADTLLPSKPDAEADVSFAPLTAIADARVQLLLNRQDRQQTDLTHTQVLITNKVMVDHNLLQRMPALKLVQVAATGINNVDLAATKARGVQVRNVAGYSTPSVAQHTFTLLNALLERIGQVDADVRHGGWDQHEHFSRLLHPYWELAGKKFLVLGYGSIGKAVGVIAQAFGMELLKAQLPGRPAKPDHLPLQQAVEQADVISLHCPLTEQTDKLVNETFLGWMQSHALLLNTARGGLIDEHALFEALNDNRIGGAALDVLSQEPPPSDHVLIKNPLPNLIISPHIAWASREARQRLIHEMAKNIKDFVAGGQRNLCHH